MTTRCIQYDVAGAGRAFCLTALCLAAMLATHGARAGEEPPIPGARLRASPAFTQQKPNDQRWALHTVDLAARDLVPQITAAQSVVVYSLDPMPADDFRPGQTDHTHFHGYLIFGQTTIAGRSELQAWRRTFTEGLIPAEMVRCFAPRHGVRIETPKKTVDLLLCFECGKMRVYGLERSWEAPDSFFDPVVLGWLNEFLDHQKIKRDIPKSATGSANSN